MTVKTTNWRSLGKRIRSLRRERGLSQDDLAAPKYSAAYISHLENGKRHPSHEALDHVASKLGMSVEQLLTGRHPDDDLRLEVDIQRSIAGIHAGEGETARKRLVAARNDAKKVGYRRAEIRAEEGIALALYRAGEWQRAFEAYLVAESIVEGTDPASKTTARVGMARCLFQKGDVREAIHVLESHLIELNQTESPDPTSLLETYAALIGPYFESGLVERAKDAAERGWEIAAGVHDPEQLACLYVNRAGLLLNQGQRREALASLALAEDLYHQLGWNSEIVKVAIARAMVEVDNDRLDNAESLLRGALADRPGSVTPTDRARALTQLAHITRLKGDAAEALVLTKEAIRIAGDRIPAEVAEAHREAGLCLVELGDHTAAEKEWRKALDVYRETGHHEESAKTARLIGDHLSARGDVEAAAREYRAGLAALEELR